MRRDGVTLGFTSHDRDLTFDGVRHRAAPGMVPSAIRRTADLSPDSAGVEGVLSHSAITSGDLAAGRFDNARIFIGAVDWETLDRATLYHGTLGDIVEDGGKFTADLTSAKAMLAKDVVPRTSPTCRAKFCGPGCSLSAEDLSSDARLASFDLEQNAVTLSGIDPAPYLYGELRWFDGPHAGIRMQIIDISLSGLVLDMPISSRLVAGIGVRLKQGCDHTLATCQSRFGNAINFQGEPFLPGNDLLARYPLPE